MQRIIKIAFILKGVAKKNHRFLLWFLTNANNLYLHLCIDSMKRFYVGLDLLKTTAIRLLFSNNGKENLDFVPEMFKTGYAP